MLSLQHSPMVMGLIGPFYKKEKANYSFGLTFLFLRIISSLMSFLAVNVVS